VVTPPKLGRVERC